MRGTLYSGGVEGITGQRRVGLTVGGIVEGSLVGCHDGVVGASVGSSLGAWDVFREVGLDVDEGMAEGAKLGTAEGDNVGAKDGHALGERDGLTEGLDGAAVGLTLGRPVTRYNDMLLTALLPLSVK